MDRAKVLAFALGPLGTSAVALVTVPLLTWLFDAQDIGRLSLLQSVVAVAVVAVALGLDQAYVREFHEVEREGPLLAGVAAPALGTFLLAAVVVAMLWQPVAIFLSGSPDPAVAILLVMCVGAGLFARFGSLTLRMHERAMLYSASQIASKVLLLLGIIVVAGWTDVSGFLRLGLAQTFAFAAAAGLVAWLSRGSIREAAASWRVRAPLAPLLAFSLPLSASVLLYTALAAVGAVGVRMLAGFDQLGLYSVAISVAGVATVVQGIFSIVWSPIVYRWAAEGSDMRRVDVVARQVLAVVAMVCVLVGTFSWLVAFVLPREYEAVSALVLCAIVQPLLYTLGEVTGIGVSLSRRTIPAMIAAAVALLVVVSGCLLLVPALGSAGALVASAVAFWVFFVVRTEWSARLWVSFPRARMHVVVAMLVAAAIATTLVGPVLGWTVHLAWAALGLIVVILFRREYAAVLRGLSGRRAA